MDRLSFLGNPKDEDEVDALLSQLSDEHVMRLKVNSHSKFNKYPSLAAGSGKWSRTDDDDAVLDSELISRLANLKAAPLRKSSSTAKSKGKQMEAKKENSGGLSRRSPSPEGKDVVGGGGSDRRKLSRSQSHNSSSAVLSERSSSGDNPDDSEDIDANLMARFLALKEIPSPNSSDPGLLKSSGSLSSSKRASNDYYKSVSFGSSSMNLLGRPCTRNSPRAMSTAVATSCHCSTPSPFKLLKQLRSKRIPSKPASLPNSPSSDSSSAARGQSTGNEKSAKKESSTKKKLQHKNREEEAENLSTVKDVKRLLSSVADRVSLERNRVSSAEDDDCLSGDVRTFSLLDREKEYLKASSDEEKLNREAERVVEWAKDAARVGLNFSDGEDEELEFGEDDLDSDSSTDKHIKKADDSKQALKPKKKEKKKKWGLF